MNYMKYLMLAWLTHTCFLHGETSSAFKITKIGETEFLFYMTEEKQKISQDLIRSLNDKQLLLVSDVYTEPVLTVEISALASILPNQTEGPYIDPTGNSILDEYGKKVRNIVKDELSIEIEAPSREINLIVSHDAHKFHQDQFKHQYDYLYANHAELPECKIIHDLTLMDWNMSKGTISGTLLQDTGGDRLLVALFPNSVVGMITAEAPVYPQNGEPPSFPGPTTLPYHAVVSPIDFHGGLTPGSSKGQRVSTVIRGIVKGDAFKDLRQQASQIIPYRPIQEKDENGINSLKYENGIVMKDLQTRLVVDLTWNYKMPDQENLEILKTDPRANKEAIGTLLNIFGIKDVAIENVLVRHLIKKDGGFTRLDLLDLNLPANYQIILINNSTIPEEYRYYQLAEDLTGRGYPWIHLYQFFPNKAMLLNQENFKNLMLTPIEELLYRDEFMDVNLVNGQALLPKIVTRIDLFAIPR